MALQLSLILIYRCLGSVGKTLGLFLILVSALQKLFYQLLQSPGRWDRLIFGNSFLYWLIALIILS